MNKKSLAYWLVTGLFCFAMGSGGLLNLIRSEEQQKAIMDLGYPLYLMSILGVAKVLGVIALLLPKTPLLKEWAYAGFTFDLLGASASHVFAGHAPPDAVVPIVVLLVGVGSYLLRPTSRRLAVVGHAKADPRSTT